MTCETAARLVDAYVDGELELTACVELEAHLASCESCRQKVAERRDLKKMLRAEVPLYSASPFLATRVKAALRGEESEPATTWQRWPTSWIFGGLAGAVACLALGLFLAMSGSSARLAHEAIADHVRSLQASHLVDVASTDQHTVKPWFAGKLDYSPQVVDLGPSGFPLIGGRLDVLDGRNVAAIIYERRKHFINLFIWPAGMGVRSSVFEQDGYHVVVWTKDDMNYVAVSELGEKELREFTKLIRDQLPPPME